MKMLPEPGAGRAMVWILLLLLTGCVSQPSVSEKQADVDYDLLLTVADEDIPDERVIRLST